LAGKEEAAKEYSENAKKLAEHSHTLNEKIRSAPTPCRVL